MVPTTTAMMSLVRPPYGIGGPPIPYGGLANDIIAVVVGTIIYLAFGLVLHPLWIGAPVFGSAEVVT